MKRIVLLVGAVAGTFAFTFAEDAYIEADGTQAIVTDYYPNPTTKIVADYAYTAVTPTQMAVFGCEGNLVVRHYINGSGGYAFAFRDSSGDWLPVVPSGQFTATTDRRTFVLDGEGEVGTLMLAGASFASGTLVVDVGANGASDCLSATGTLDLSNLSLALSDATALDETKVYTIATASAVTGRFANVDLPRKWRATVHPTHVTLAYANGTVFLFR